MSLERFSIDPWKNQHGSYSDSAFNIRPAPEFATAEVLVASVYRAVGLDGCAEQGVPASGRLLDKARRRPPAAAPSAPRIGLDAWQTILHKVLESPKQPKQSSKRFLQLSPVVPEVARYSGSARLVGNSWNPGALIRNMIQLGCPSHADAVALWSHLFEALSVGPADDIWARWLQDEFESWRTSGSAWSEVALPDTPSLPTEDKVAIQFPAQQFVRDLDAILGAKQSMTRRQWVSLLEAILRLGSVSHVLWLCDVNDKLWSTMRAVLAGDKSPTVDEVRKFIVSGHGPD